MPDHSRSQTETYRVARNGLWVLLIATAILLVFNSARLRSAVRDLPPSHVTDYIVLAADKWHEIMQAAGADKVTSKVRKSFNRLHQLRWEAQMGASEEIRTE